MNNNKPVVVIDTNLLLVSISSRSRYHWLYNAILNGDFFIAITSEILLEYKEKIISHWSTEVAVNVVRSITELPNAIFTQVYFQLELIKVDVDDNKFVDCAFAANADFIITHDAHFNVLKNIPFPRIPLLTIHQFQDIIGK